MKQVGYIRSMKHIYNHCINACDMFYTYKVFYTLEIISTVGPAPYPNNMEKQKVEENRNNRNFK